ncbi:MAG: small multi-drug export protein [Nitrososphaerales archaeon]
MSQLIPRWLNRAFRFTFPFGAAAIFFLLISLVDSQSLGKMFPFLAGYILPPLGKESMIPAAILSGVNPVVVSSTIITLDSLTAVFMVLNFDLLYSLPRIGRSIKKFEESGEKTLKKRRWIKRFSTVGLVLFMLIPFQGTGAIATSLIGRLAGVDVYRVVAAVFVGSVMTTATFTSFSRLISSFFAG